MFLIVFIGIFATSSGSLRIDSPSDFSSLAKVMQLKGLAVQSAIVEHSSDRVLESSEVLEANAATPSGYLVQTFYLGTNCSGSPLSTQATPVGVCFNNGNNGYQNILSSTQANNVVTTTTGSYSDASCSTSLGSITSPTSTCLTVPLISGKTTVNIAMRTTISSSLPSFTSAGTITKYFLTASCTDSYPTYLWVVGNGGCFTSTNTSSLAETCTATSVTLSTYNSMSCTGTAKSTKSKALSGATTCDNNFAGISCVGVESSSSSSSSSSCFLGTETVQLENGEIIPISEASVGHRILSADENSALSYSAIVYVPHTKNDVISSFVKMTMESGRSISMTPEHLTLVQPACKSADKSVLVKAKDLYDGSCLVTTSGFERISSVEIVLGKGVYSVVTEKPFIVVSGVVASPFATNHMVANAYYNIHRAVYKATSFAKAPFWLSGLQRIVEVFVQMVLS